MKPWDPTQDTFVEKLSIQIIKNLQIKVTSLHLRHEDAFINPKRPISIGITLKELVFQVGQIALMIVRIRFLENHCIMLMILIDD